MLRKRVVTVLTFNDGVLFRTKLFQPDYRYTLNFVDAWSVDEVVILDVTRPGQGKRENFEDVVASFARRCFVPVSAGGGIRSIEDVRRFMALGADKVVVNTGAIERPELITEIASQYGAQCVVLSVDAKPEPAGGYQVYSQCGQTPTGFLAADWAKRGVELGAGEVLITAMEKDGWLQGYDLDLCRHVVEAVPVPVLALGGAGTWQHMVDVFNIGVDAACTQNIYHFTETSIKSAKNYLSNKGILVRI